MSDFGCEWPRRRVPGAPVVVAHRGASSQHQESSAESFQAAIAIGATAIETDARITRDGVLVCNHDDTLLRTTGNPKAVSDIDLAEMMAATGGRCMTLERAIRTIGQGCGILIDVKLTKPADIDALIGLVRAEGALSDVALGVRSLAMAVQVRAALPRQPLVGLLQDPNDLANFAALGNVWWRLWESDLTDERIAATRALGLPLLVMVGGKDTGEDVGDISDEALRGLLRRPIDGLMINNPAQALQAIAQAPAGAA